MDFLKYKFILTVSLLLLNSINLFAQTGVFVPELVNFDTAMTNLMKRYDIPGGQMAITYKGNLVYNRGFGYANLETLKKVEPENSFRVGSVSKTITAIAIMKLVEKGLINLNDTVFGPGGILNDPQYRNIIDPRVLRIRVRNLLNHTGGWNRNLSGDPVLMSFAIAENMGTTPPADAETTIRYIISSTMLDFDPGTQFQYSNLGYMILGRVIEKVTGLEYETYVRDSVLLPAGADIHSGFNLKEGRLQDEVNYYDYPGAPLVKSVYDNKTLVVRPYGALNLEAMAAEGGWVSSARNLCRIIGAVDKYPTIPEILLQASVDTMIKPCTVNRSYAMGLYVNSFGTWWHDGSLYGTTAYISRTNYQLNWAIVMNGRPEDFNNFSVKVQMLFWNVLPTISTWPDHDITTSVQNTENEHGIRIFPNPSDGRFSISTNMLISSVEIYDLTGVKIYTSTQTFPSGIAEINISSAPAGIYFLKVKSGSGNRVVRLIIK